MKYWHKEVVNVNLTIVLSCTSVMVEKPVTDEFSEVKKVIGISL